MRKRVEHLWRKKAKRNKIEQYQKSIYDQKWPKNDKKGTFLAILAHFLIFDYFDFLADFSGIRRSSPKENYAHPAFDFP
jgi:hypothetical protein